MIKKLWREFIENFVLKHPALFSALIIYLYYLFTTLDLFKKVREGIISFSDIFTHFDSLLWIWGLSYLFVKLVNLQEQRHKEEKLRLEQIKQYETQLEKLKALKNFTFSLRDLIYNPLAIIMSASARIERRFPYDNETLKDIRAIEQGCKRIEKLLMEVKEFEERLIIGEEGTESKLEQSEIAQTK
jgi:signal transduction histidine kinase